MTAATATAALDPLRAALLADARAAGERLRAQARADTDAALAAARERAEQMIAEAHALGVEDARARLQQERARVHRANRTLVLVAQRGVYDDVVRRCQAAVRSLVEESGAHARLEARIRRRLGPTASVHPAPGGGLIGQAADGSTVDASVAALVQQALNMVDLEPLWTAS